MHRSQTIARFLLSQRDFQQFASALTLTEVDVPLGGPGPFTVFAPSNRAFLRLSLDEVQRHLSSEQRLREVVLHHVVAGAYAHGALLAVAGSSLSTLAGEPMAVGRLGPQLRVDGHVVPDAEVELSNGVVHFVDRVLLPGHLSMVAPLAGPPSRVSGAWLH